MPTSYFSLQSCFAGRWDEHYTSRRATATGGRQGRRISTIIAHYIPLVIIPILSCSWLHRSCFCHPAQFTSMYIYMSQFLNYVEILTCHFLMGMCLNSLLQLRSLGYTVEENNKSFELIQGSLDYPSFGYFILGIKLCKSVVILRDFPFIVHCLGWSYSDNCKFHWQTSLQMVEQLETSLTNQLRKKLQAKKMEDADGLVCCTSWWTTSSLAQLECIEKIWEDDPWNPPVNHEMNMDELTIIYLLLMASFPAITSWGW